MFNPLDYPFLILFLSLAVFWASASIGAWLRKRTHQLPEGAHEDFAFVLGATLTLLGLLIGFSFSMAVSRYDQRKNYEEAEANAIGTEYVRADLLPASAGTSIRDLLRKYTDQRVLFYTTHNRQNVEKINSDTAKLQSGLWSAVGREAAAQPTAIVALAVS